MTGAVLASLARAADDLDRVPARWALVGGFAVSARAEPRFTRDVDVCVLVATDEEAEHMVRAMVGVGYSIESLVEHEDRQRLATLRLVTPLPGGVVLDVLFASSGVEAEIVESAERLEIVPGLRAPVAQAGHLVVLKLLARDDQTRPQDAIDLRALRSILSLADEDEARRLAELVVTRGYHRNRDLRALLAAYLSGT